MKAIFHSTCLLLVCLVVSRCTHSTQREETETVSALPLTTFRLEASVHKAFAAADSANFEESTTLLRQAAAQYKLTQNWKAYVGCLNGIGGNFIELANKDSAGFYLHRALEKGILLNGTSSAMLAQTYNLFGELSYIQGKVDEADSLFKIALHLRQNLAKPDPMAVAESQYQISRIHYSRKEYRQAINVASAALAAQQKSLGERHKSVALSYNILALSYMELAELEKAEVLYTKALSITQQVRGRYHPQLGKLYNNLGILYRKTSRASRALSCFEKAFTIYNRSLGKHNQYAAYILTNMGLVAHQHGDYEKAIAYFNNALLIDAQKHGLHSLPVAQLYGNMGLAFAEWGRLDDALRKYAQSLAIRSEKLNPDDRAMIPLYINMATTLNAKGDVKTALLYAQKAMALYLPPNNEPSAKVHFGYNLLASIYVRMKDYTQAIAYYQKSLAVVGTNFGVQSVEVAEVQTYLAEVRLLKGEAAKALTHSRQAITSLLPGFTNIPNATPNLSKNASPYLIKVFTVQADAYKQLYEQEPKQSYLEAALASFEWAVQAIDQLKNTYRGEQAKLYLNSFNYATYHRALEVAARLYTLTENRQYIEKAYYFSEKSKAVVLAGVLKEVSAKSSAGIPDSIRQREDDLRNRIAFYEKQIYEQATLPSAGQPIQVIQWNSKVSELKREYDLFTRQVEHTFPAYHYIKYAVSLDSIPAIQQRLAKDEAVVAYTLANTSTYIFTITSQTYTFTRLSHHTAQQDSLIAFAKAVTQDQFYTYTRLGYTLYHRFFAPIQPQLRQKKRLIIIPDAQLGYIPFEILLTHSAYPTKKDFSNLPYLLRDYSFTYHYSVNVWMEMQKRNRKPIENKQSFIGFAVSSPPTSEPLNKLRPDSVSATPTLVLNQPENEVREIAETMGGFCYTQKGATENQFKASAQESTILHLATHALVNEQEPLDTKIVLAADEQAREDGYLHTYELYNLKLNASLVTLSACNTGVGQFQQGEGIISLARGFIYAGCPSVVMSLWPANDQSTATLMQHFYAGLREGLPKDEALRQAKLKHLQTAGPLYANPFFWGSCVLIGDPESIAIPKKSLLKPIYPGVAVLLLLLGFILMRKRRLQQKS